MAYCPCCGQETDKPDVAEIVQHIAEGPLQLELLNYMAKNFNRWRFYKDMADYVYSLDPDGGPDKPETVLRIVGWRLMKSDRLRRAGLKIESNRKRGVRLVWAD